jgi:hypothetical protein
MIQVGSCKSTHRVSCPDISCKLHHVNAAVRVKKDLCGKLDRLNLEASCDLHETFVYIPASGLTQANLHCLLTDLSPQHFQA